MYNEYLYGSQYDWYTDNSPLIYLLSTAKLDATGHRWVAGLGNNNFIIHYWSGKSNVEADTLSRIQWNKVITSEAVQEVIVNVTQCIRSPLEVYSNSEAILDTLQQKIGNGPFIHVSVYNTYCKQNSLASECASDIWP